MKPKKQLVHRLWYKAKLSPAAQGLYTEGFYPTPKRGTGAQYVFFTQVDVTPSTHRVLVASRLEESGIRMMTQDLATRCLIPMSKASKAEMLKLNELTVESKV